MWHTLEVSDTRYWVLYTLDSIRNPVGTLETQTCLGFPSMMRIWMVLMVGAHAPGGYPHVRAAVVAHLSSLKLQNKCVLHCVLHA